MSFKIRDAMASWTRWLIKDLERRRLRGKSKVKIPVSMQDDAAAKRFLSGVIIRHFFRKNSHAII